LRVKGATTAPTTRAGERGDLKNIVALATSGDEYRNTVVTKTDLVSFELVERAILLIRGQRVLLDRDLATLYQVDVKVLNQAVRKESRTIP